ncbi:hypothetical protein [Streptomyces sp. NPDC058664]|uniref:hypothetical protein n=1 Tax=unclassified Streptomyces TaxID=2593676 RepID=UPI003660FCC3
MCDCDCERSKCDRWKQVENAHASELAEQLRDRAGVFGVFRSEDMRMRAEAFRAAADLIDPEVST